MGIAVSTSGERSLRILGCPCEPFPDETAVKARLAEIVEAGQGGYAVSINAEKIHSYRHDGRMRAVVDGSVLPVADGAGAVIGLRLMHGAKSAKIDLPRSTMELCNERGYRLFIAGASEASNSVATRTIAQRYPNIRIVGRIHGYVSDEEIVAAACEAEPQLMLLALGSPRQEVASLKLIEAIPSVFVVSCGGALDIMAGKLKRAPRFMIENNLEWLYRLYKEPARWQRQLVLPKFMIRLLAAAAADRMGLARRG